MKSIVLSLLILCSLKNLTAQNVGIGTNEPLNKLQVTGSILVNTPTVVTSTAPTAPQTKTLINATTINFASADSTGRIYDPGGPVGNYPANVVANAYIQITTCVAFEIIVESMDLSTGDSLIIKDDIAGNTLLAVGNGYSSTGKWILNSSEFGTLYLIFKSNADANTGTGFSLLFRRLFDNSSSLTNISGNAGTGLFFDVKNGAFRCGSVNNSFRGLNSVAMGKNTSASGGYSFAMGNTTTASGNFSTAMGGSTKAEGNSSVAMGSFSSAYGDLSFAMGSSAVASGNTAIALGYLTNASGTVSTAMGAMTNASGYASTAMGNNTDATADYSTATGINTTASGLRSTAMGNNASTNGQANSFCIGGTGAATICTGPNQFMTRFDNYTFWISASNYAYLLPSSNGWAYTSDRNKKERFEELDGETVLKKIAGIPFCSWNFKAADTKQYRHYGIAAQDFYTAFGKDRYGKIGNDTTVSPLDLLGVAYSAIKALEKRSTDLLYDNKQLKEENALLQKNMDEIKDGYAQSNMTLNKKLALLEAKLNELVVVKEKEVGAATTVAKQK